MQVGKRERPLISYVVTFYNKVPYLPYLLAGIAGQQGDFDKQCIFVDDGSTDGTVALLRELTADWPNVTIIEQPNQGPAIALNAGFTRVTGDFIKPIDGDDILLPWATNDLLRALQETQCGVAYANMKMQGALEPLNAG
jgi:glycosyltransferase involved in cell wall biosynthesis